MVATVPPKTVSGMIRPLQPSQQKPPTSRRALNQAGARRVD